jgi:PAS domain S-box-containing protein
MFAHQQESRDWNSDETRVVQETAERTWRAVERARVTEAFKESEARLSKDLDDAKRLQKISGELIKEEDTVALFQEIVDTAIEIMRSDMGTLQMYDSAREELRLISTRGFHSDAGEAWSRINIDSGTACAAALLRGERVIVPDVTHSDVIVGDANEEYFAISGIRSVQSTPLISRSGRIVGMISTHWKTRHVPREGELRFLDLLARQAADILDRTNAAGALRASEERFRLLSESFYDFAIFTTDADGRVVTWNPGAEKIFGFSPDDIIGHTARLLFVPEDQAKGEPEREMTTAREKGRAADERWHMRKDGRRFYASGIMAPLYEGEALIGYAKIARDLTKEKQFQEELRRQHEELEAIVAGRTAELGEANDALREQIEERERMEAERFALLQKLVTSQEDERRRIARDMHDSLGQQLTALRLKLASMKTDLYRDGRLGEGLERLQELAKRLDEEVNFLVWELRPTVLDDLGLVAAIENYVQEWVRHYGISAEFHAGKLGETRLAPDVETNLYRITQEALNNTYKHAKAKNANIVLESRNKEVVLVIEDDGIGFNADAVRPSPEESRGLGLVGMRERASIIGGKVEIESSPGNGTTVFVRVPMTRRD